MISWMTFPFRFVYAVWAWTVLAAGFSLHVAFANTFMRFSADSTYFHVKTTRPFLKAMFFLVGIRVRVSGLEHIDVSNPRLIIANHASNLDILLLILTVPADVAFVAKQELIKAPILNQHLIHQKHLLIDRQNPKKSLKTLLEVPTYIKKGRFVVVCPEGARSKDGQLKPFKRSAFAMAVKHSLPVIPCCISGSGRLVPATSLMLRPGVVHVRFGELIACDGVDADTLLDQAFSAVKSLHVT